MELYDFMIHWNVSPEIFSFGFIHIRWYGLLFAGSFLVGLYIMSKIFRNENKSEEDLNDLVWYMIIGTVVGARLGHCLFYNPSFYLSHPVEILMVWKGGLASHGAAIGILTAIYFYSKKKKDQPYLWVLDRVVITVAIGGAMIRIGNLFNSEIIGKPTDGSWGFIFERAHIANPMIPRHPTQIYEAVAYFITFVVLYSIYKKHNGKLNEGYLSGLLMVMIFVFRFFVEFFKEVQEPFEVGMPLDMGQILSIPIIIVGIYLIIRSKKLHKKNKGTNK